MFRKLLMVAAVVAAPVHAEVTPELAYAHGMIGINERDDKFLLKALLNLDPTETSWCAAFMNYVLEKHGEKTTGSLLAKSFLKIGEETFEPTLGDILVFSRGTEEWKGHVGFYMGETEDTYWVLGGNQSNAVSIKQYTKSRLISARRY
ncbi:MAG: TIGR02594 family protein [Candidatus Thiodiazotropha taylori]|uniref:TIGR02594 family protein n=1 Tax=Candidatus Thiodiazotropha taylori TaxID=2792791 RepID=A0A9E4KAV7_9GAMM|nr:TIGR02594 family protein [Candidatus Thiodiazotropha taylori]MCW4255064.1 TIGR02594 family protein [Candidatus Thiodiazotropha taylori]